MRVIDTIGIRGGALAIAVLGCALTGCGGLRAGEADETSVERGAITSTITSDTSGLVKVKLKACDWSDIAPHPESICELDPGWVLVGGGAEIQAAGPEGPMLWGSYPTFGQAWVARSKDHVVSFPHRVRAYAVGMQLVDMDYATLNGLVTRTPDTSVVSNRPSAAVAIPDGHIMLGGGGVLSLEGAGALLTETRPVSSTVWIASGKDHQIPDTEESVTAWVISVPACLNGLWSHGCLRSVQKSNTAYTFSGEATADVVSFEPAVTGVGAVANWNTYGRLLTDVYPVIDYSSSGGTATSTDHHYAESGSTGVWSIAVFRSAAP